MSLPAGALVDRWNRKQVMILCDAGRALNAAAIPLAMLFNLLTIWQLYAAALIEGTLFVFFNIAEVAAMPRVVPKAQLPAATAQNSPPSARPASSGRPSAGSSTRPWARRGHHSSPHVNAICERATR